MAEIAKVWKSFTIATTTAGTAAVSGYQNTTGRVFRLEKAIFVDLATSGNTVVSILDAGSGGLTNTRCIVAAQFLSGQPDKVVQIDNIHRDIFSGIYIMSSGPVLCVTTGFEY